MNEAGIEDMGQRRLSHHRFQMDLAKVLEVAIEVEANPLGNQAGIQILEDAQRGIHSNSDGHADDRKVKGEKDTRVPHRATSDEVLHQLHRQVSDNDPCCESARVWSEVKATSDIAARLKEDHSDAHDHKIATDNVVSDATTDEGVPRRRDVPIVFFDVGESLAK